MDYKQTRAGLSDNKRLKVFEVLRNWLQENVFPSLASSFGGWLSLQEKVGSFDAVRF
jgi:hypothetical protein